MNTDQIERRIGSLPPDIGKGTLQVELVFVGGDDERGLIEKVAEIAQLRQAVGVLVSDIKHGMRSEYTYNNLWVRDDAPEQTYCLAVFSTSPASVWPTPER